jgi:hypothetical protein
MKKPLNSAPKNHVLRYIWQVRSKVEAAQSHKGRGAAAKIILLQLVVPVLLAVLIAWGGGYGAFVILNRHSPELSQVQAASARPVKPASSGVTAGQCRELLNWYLAEDVGRKERIAAFKPPPPPEEDPDSGYFKHAVMIESSCGVFAEKLDRRDLFRIIFADAKNTAETLHRGRP